MLVFSTMDLMSVVILPCWVGSIQVPLFEQSILCPAVHDEINLALFGTVCVKTVSQKEEKNVSFLLESIYLQ